MVSGPTVEAAPDQIHQDWAASAPLLHAKPVPVDDHLEPILVDKRKGPRTVRHSISMGRRSRARGCRASAMKPSDCSSGGRCERLSKASSLPLGDAQGGSQ
jgi:hypothetical protein